MTLRDLIEFAEASRELANFAEIKYDDVELNVLDRTGMILDIDSLSALDISTMTITIRL